MIDYLNIKALIFNEINHLRCELILYLNVLFIAKMSFVDLSEVK